MANPSLSQASILRQFRSQGFSISNRAGRAIINESRIEIQRGAERLNRLVNDAFQGRFKDTRFVDFTLREIDLRGKSEKVVENTLRNNIREREVFFNDRRGQGVRVSDFTHVHVEYEANATFTTAIEGRVLEQSHETIQGSFTAEVTSFTEEFLAVRVRQTAIGQFTQKLSEIQGLGANSIIDGLTVEMSEVDVNITSLNPRGSRGPIPNRGSGRHVIATI